MTGAIVALISVLATVFVMRLFARHNKRIELEAQDEHDAKKRLLEVSAQNETRQEADRKRLEEDQRTVVCPNPKCNREQPGWSMGPKMEHVTIGNQSQGHTVSRCHKCRNPEQPTPLPGETREAYTRRQIAHDHD